MLNACIALFGVAALAMTMFLALPVLERHLDEPRDR